jgi:hypothetical protein
LEGEVGADDLGQGGGIWGNLGRPRESESVPERPRESQGPVGFLNERGPILRECWVGRILCETGETGPGNTVGPPAPGCGGTQPVVRQGESFRRRAGEGMSSLAGHARSGSGRLRAVSYR